jgi:hypothetical protein
MIAEMLPILLSILSNAPQVIEEVRSAWALLSSKETPTADQQAAIDAALDEAHRALQAS